MFRRTTTLLTPAETYDLVSIDDLKIDLGITGDSDDPFLERAIARASASVAQYCNRVFPVESVQDVFDFDGEVRGGLQAARFPLVDIVSIERDGDVLEADTDYRVDVESGLIYEANGLWLGSSVTVVYSGGFETIPADVQNAVTDMVRSLQFNKSRDPLLRSENILSGLYAYTLFAPGEVPSGTAQQVAPALEPYRVLSI